MLRAYELWERDTMFNVHKKVVVTNVDLYTNTDAVRQLFTEHFYYYDELMHSFYVINGAEILPTMKVSIIDTTDTYSWDVGFEVHTPDMEHDHPWYFAFECGHDPILTIAIRQAEESLNRLMKWSKNNDR